VIRHSTGTYAPLTQQNTALLENQTDIQLFKKLHVMRHGVFTTMWFHIVILWVIMPHDWSSRCVTLKLGTHQPDCAAW